MDGWIGSQTICTARAPLSGANKVITLSWWIFLDRQPPQDPCCSCGWRPGKTSLTLPTGILPRAESQCPTTKCSHPPLPELSLVNLYPSLSDMMTSHAKTDHFYTLREGLKRKLVKSCQADPSEPDQNYL